MKVRSSVTSWVYFGAIIVPTFVCIWPLVWLEILENHEKNAYLSVKISLSRMGSFISSSRLVVLQWIKTWKEVAWNTGNPCHFHTKPLFGKIGFATVVEGFTIQIWFSHYWLNVLKWGPWQGLRDANIGPFLRIVGSAIFFGGIAGYVLPVRYNISDIFCRYYGILSWTRCGISINHNGIATWRWCFLKLNETQNIETKHPPTPTHTHTDTPTHPHSYSDTDKDTSTQTHTVKTTSLKRKEQRDTNTKIQK